MAGKIGKLSRNEALDILFSNLTEDEVIQLGDIRHQISKNIMWNALGENVYKDFQGSVVDILAKGYCRLPGALPALTTTEEKFLTDGVKGELRQRWVILSLTRKLLGLLKQRLVKEMSEIGYLDCEEEAELLEITGDLEDEVTSEIQASLELGPQVPHHNAPLERTMAATLAERQARLQIRPADVDQLIEDLTTAEFYPTSGECSHADVLIRRIPADGKERSCPQELTVCRDCAAVLDSKLIAEVEGKAIIDPAYCSHKAVNWKPGEEGKTALCDLCGKEVSPEGYKWADVGLEPPGDDPTQDEVIVLCG